MKETWVRFLVGKIPWRRKWQPTPVFLPGESHGRRSLADYSPWVGYDLANYTTTTASQAFSCVDIKGITYSLDAGSRKMFTHNTRIRVKKNVDPWNKAGIFTSYYQNKGNGCWESKHNTCWLEVPMVSLHIDMRVDSGLPMLPGI